MHKAYGDLRTLEKNGKCNFCGKEIVKDVDLVYISSNSCNGSYYVKICEGCINHAEDELDYQRGVGRR